VFNKIDRADSMALGPEETAWLRQEFPGAPTFMTSAKSGLGVEDAFSTIVSRTVDKVLAKGKKVRSGRLLRQRVLLYLADREVASKNDVFVAMKQVHPGEVMDELDNLVRLGVVTLDEAGTSTFAKSADLPGTARYRVTDRGKKVAESPKGEELAIEEIV
jgi:hypothetical protein